MHMIQLVLSMEMLLRWLIDDDYRICSRFNFSIFVLIFFSSLGWLGDSIVKYTVNKKRQERQKTNNLKSEEEKKLNKLDNIKTEVQVEDTYIQIANYYMVNNL